MITPHRLKISNGDGGARLKSVTKNIFREIARTKNRFFSIFTICAIGVGFFSGVRATGSDMKITADNYYDAHELFDLRVMSTFGLTDGDLSALEQVDGVSEAQGSKYSDLMFIYDGRDYNTRVFSWNETAKLNRIDILEGRFPQADNECILNVRKMNGQIGIGEKLVLTDPSDNEDFPLKNKEYTIVGLFDTPMYISSTQRGSTTIGDGSLDAFVYIPESNFTQEVYTEIYIQSEQLKGVPSYSYEYEQLRDDISDKLDELGIDRSEIRYNEVIGEAQQKIADGKKEIQDAGEAKWYVFTRDDNPGYAEYSSNAERIDKIAAIFPVFFLLVAALVCLTTMSRMVEEQRMQIGTLKSLGYSNAVIMRQYMVYAVLAAASGSLIGAFIGMFLFPFIIMFAYSMMYIISNFYYELSPFNIVISAGSMVAAIALTVFFSARNALSGTPAELMRPRAPKAGKRVLLEKIGFIWDRLSFFGKVSGRNLFRYKRRMFMTVIGIAGCTALSLTGFGLKDSISDIVDLQYNSINNYSGFIAYENQDDVQGIYDALLEYQPETEYTRALIKQYTVTSDSGSVQCYVTALEDTAKFEDMIDLRSRTTGEKITFEQAGGGVIVTEKLTKLLGVKTGDTVTLRISDGNTREVTIGAVTEHYTSHYMYIPEEKYSELFGDAPDYNIVYFKNGMSSEQSVQDEFTTRMLAVDGVLTVTVNSGASSQFADMLKIMDLVVVVLIISAGALAFVVLYNLTNVNITERIREIATLKVLGFYDNEVSSYVFRENNILSVMGGVLGLGVGVALCQFVIQTAEIDEVMFGRNIHPLSFLWAFLITVAFSLIVNFIMRRDLRKISMVESLKSVE